MESALYSVYALFYLFICLFIYFIRNLTRSLRSLYSLVRFLVGQQLVRKYRTPVLFLKYSIFTVLIFMYLILQGRCNFNAI